MKRPLRVGLQVPGDLGEDHGAAREGDGDRRAKRNAPGSGRDGGERKKWIMLRLDRPQTVESHLLVGSRLVREALEGPCAEHGIDLHAVSI